MRCSSGWRAQSGLPARDLYGLRVAPSSQFPSLGRAGGNVTTAQHCRAEVWADNFGWIPVDPADVRKLILEEKKPSLSDPYVAKARETLFGSWEMNWIAFNDAHDVVLPGSKGKPLPFLMYPQAEVGGDAPRQPRSRALQVHHHRARSVIAGINYPWTIFEGKPNYGCDFGRNKWNSHAGVTAHLDDVRADFDGDGGGRVRGHALVRVHRRPRRRRLERERRARRPRRSSSSTTWTPRSRSPRPRRAPVPGARRLRVDRRSRAARRARIAGVRSIACSIRFSIATARSDAIHSFDVINEPDWVTEGLATDPKRGVWPIDRLRTFVGPRPIASTRDRAALVTLGGGRVRFAREWDDPVVRSRLRAGPFVSGCAVPGSR